MIWVARNAKTISMRQGGLAPVVYLDLWALMDFADEGLRLAEILRRNGGTLALSGLHLLEFGKVGRRETRRKVELLLDAICPHLCFLELRIGKVLAREEQRNRGSSAGGAQFDDELLEVFVLRGRSGLEYDGLTATGLLDELRTDSGVETSGTALRSIAHGFQEYLESLRAEYANDPKRRRSTHALPKPSAHVPATRQLYMELMNSLVRDGIQMGPNDWHDFAHSVVPVAYCDLVVLDRRWTGKVREACGRLQKAGAIRQCAAVFGPNELDRFWESLGEPTAGRSP